MTTQPTQPKTASTIDAYWLGALCAMAVAIPFGIATVITAKTGAVPTIMSWFFVWVPGFGLGAVMLMGQALTARAALTLEVSPSTRWAFGGAWLTMFSCMLTVVPLAVYAGAERVSISAMIQRLAPTANGELLTLAYYVALILATELPVPALLIASRLEANQTARREEQQRREDMATARVAETMLSKSRPGSSSEAIVMALQEGPATAADLVSKTGYTDATVRKTLKGLDNVTMVPGKRPAEFQLVPRLSIVSGQ